MCVRSVRSRSSISSIFEGGTILGLLASGHDMDKVLAAYPYLEREDILEALAFAAWRVEEREMPMKAA